MRISNFGAWPFSCALLLAATPGLDEGLLDPSWFSTDPIEFRESGKLDYVWVRSGFDIKDRSLQFVPWQPKKLPAHRDEKDRTAATKFKEAFPESLRQVFAENLASTKIVATDGELRLVGRLVDANAGNAWAYVMPNYTFELKVVDSSDVLQVAIHTRFVGKANKSNMKHWSQWIVKPFVEGIEDAWRKGKVPKS